VRESAEQNARRAVEFIRGKFPEASVKIDVIVELGRPAQIIVETAEDWDADLVVVGSHGRGFWRRLTLGSISDAVSHHARCAVLIAKDHKRAAKV
jgi:nucleotide-binding universal stress UspA family protein